MNILHLKPLGQILLVTGFLCINQQSVMALPLAAEIKAYSAQKKFEEGRYEEAVEGYKTAAEKAPEHLKPILQYNQATSAAFAGETTAAQELLEQTYAADNPALNSAAKYNIGTGIAKASRDSITATKDAANKTLNDPGILDLAEKNTGTGKAQQPSPEMTQSLQAAAEQVQKTLQLVDAGITTTSQLGSLWRDALIELPGEKDAQHNAEVTALDKERLTEQKTKLEELLKKLTPPDSKDQQKQSQDQKQQDQQNQNQQQQQDQQKQDQKQNQQKQDPQQAQKDNEQQDQQKQDQNSEQKKDTQTAPSSNDGSEKDKQKDRQEPKPPGNDQQNQTDDNQAKNSKSENRQQSAKKEPVKIGEMTEEDVQRMMNALPEDNEKVLQQILNIPTRPSATPDKDW